MKSHHNPIKATGPHSSVIETDFSNRKSNNTHNKPAANDKAFCKPKSISINSKIFEVPVNSNSVVFA
jgi:hypothetical protein